MIRGNGSALHGHPLVRLGKQEGFFRQQIDDSDKSSFVPQGKLKKERRSAQFFFHLLQRTPIVGAEAVHLGNEADSRHPVPVSLTPHRFTLGLHPLHGAEDGDSSVKNPHASLDFNGKIDVSRRINQVNPVSPPATAGGGGGNRDAALLLLGHPVHHRLPVVHLLCVSPA